MVTILLIGGRNLRSLPDSPGPGRSDRPIRRSRLSESTAGNGDASTGHGARWRTWFIMAVAAATAAEWRGFFSGLLGGLGGAMAGNWLDDQMSGTTWWVNNIRPAPGLWGRAQLRHYPT